MTRAELAHTLNTLELSPIAKKLPVTLLRRTSDTTKGISYGV